MSKKDNITKRTTSITSPLKSSINSLVSNNPSFSYALKKTDKLTSALHLVTTFIEKDEPLSRLLRERSLSILSSIVACGEGTLPARHVRAQILELVSFLRVAFRAGYISETHYALLEEEYVELGVFLEQHEEMASQGQITKETLRVPTEETTKHKRHLSTKKDIRTSHELQSKKHSDRRAAIIDLLASKGKISVKDVAAVVTDCSEKTLQRELLQMVHEGILKKEGERRWSTYLRA